MKSQAYQVGYSFGLGSWPDRSKREHNPFLVSHVQQEDWYKGFDEAFSWMEQDIFELGQIEQFKNI